MKEAFLLTSEKAKLLYSHVKALPVVDYHNHLSVEDITENKRFLSVYELWIKPDPYKHRAMRMCGVDEEHITGSASDEDKFVAWCQTLPKLIGNPLYHWSMMELDTVFGIQQLPNGSNAAAIYEQCNRYLAENEITVTTLLDRFSVSYACPCASLTDDLTAFYDSKQISPSLRGDDIVNISAEFVKKLQVATGMEITDMSALKAAIWQRIQAFYDCGCRFADHAIDNGFLYYPDDGKNDKRFAAVCNGTIEAVDVAKLTSYLLVYVAECYAKIGFALQLHIGAQRFTSSRLRKLVGPAGGFAGIGNSVDVKSLTELLDRMDNSPYGLPKTILFTLNPADNALISVLSGSYSKSGVEGLITQGPAWWWCDHKQGMVEMLENAMSFSVLSNFVGMTTDSRSFLSFVRHDYFRRVLCNWIADKANCGDFPDDEDVLKELVYKLCYQNANGILVG